MPKKIKKEWMVDVMFEPSRIKDIHLATAYEKLVPPIKERINHNGIKSPLSKKNIYIKSME